MFKMSPLELDALGEIFNISVGHAAAALSELTHEVVSMSVPVVHILSAQKAVDLLDPEHKLRITSVSQQFSGSFSGKAFLMFSGSSSLEVVRLMLGAQMPLEQLTAMEQDAMSEIGNIILNSCFSTIACMLNESFDCELPRFQISSTEQLLDAQNDPAQVLFVQIQLALEQRNLEGYVAFVMGNASLLNLHNAVTRFLTGASTA
ncbi:MAG: chemotaxis protein CheC [Pseudomonas sp.]|uniref:chemotaxis protein CheX n=1 Tax=Pseudomonas sp. TaxID=306 RepID=UPI00273509CB|nr:chemotaxis protein CheX [Pseudomonas sp.]MDP3847720.1 chemotaxis protein CheC [Pseudomonas sp.]